MINYGLMIMLNKGFKLTNTNTLKVTFLICIRKKDHVYKFSKEKIQKSRNKWNIEKKSRKKMICLFV